MTLDLFFEKFDQFADAPDAVARMRELVLGLAITGKLVGQHLNEGSAAELVSEASSVREKMIAAREMRKPREIKPVAEFECSAIPSNWAWTSLGEIAEIGPRNSLEDSTLATFLPMRAIPQHYRGELTGQPRPWSELKKGFTHLADGDIALAKITPCFQNGKSAVVEGLDNGVGAGTTELHVARPFAPIVDPFYVWIFLRSPQFLREGIPHMTGSAGQKRVPAGYFAHKPFPLPPLAEQKRIVAKVDELMALCDRLEAQQQERDTRHAALARATLARFVDAPTPANLNFLFHKSFDITPADLRKSILTLAVQGKLVPQDPNDEPVEQMLVGNDERRAETAESDRRASEDKQDLLSADDRWDVAGAWCWRGLADLVFFVDYRGKTPTKITNGVRLLTAKNVRKGVVNLEPEEFISENEYHDWMTRGFPKTGDILFTTEAPMGNAAVIELTEKFALAQRVICFQSYGALDPGFLVLQLLSEPFRLILYKNGTGMTAKGIKASKLKRLPVVVPPLAEQRRIVAKVDQLMTLVDELETQIAASRATAKNLLDALVAELTASKRN